uniref:Uncharacterized protein n=1 Tax=Erpetoichthys calabaricus TaxID=27687 RepID=A0A8C4SCI0_ERPCA
MTNLKRPKSTSCLVVPLAAASPPNSSQLVQSETWSAALKAGASLKFPVTSAKSLSPQCKLEAGVLTAIKNVIWLFSDKVSAQRAIPPWLTGIIAVVVFLFLVFIVFIVNKMWCEGTSAKLYKNVSQRRGSVKLRLVETIPTRIY